MRWFTRMMRRIRRTPADKRWAARPTMESVARALRSAPDNLALQGVLWLAKDWAVDMYEGAGTATNDRDMHFALGGAKALLEFVEEVQGAIEKAMERP